MSTNSTPPPAQVLLGCSKCGANLPDGAQFCLRCGKPVSSPATKAAFDSSEVVDIPSPPARKKPKRRRVVLWIALSLVVAFLAWVGLSESPIAQQLQELAGWKHDQTILDESFNVGAHTFRYYKFSLPEGSVNVAIVGQFTAAGAPTAVLRNDATKTATKDRDKTSDSDNNIEVSVLTEPAFTVWQNGYATSSIYESGRVTTGTVQAEIPAGAGIYYLVFNNKFAPKTAKSVRSTVLLRYKSWLPESFRRMKAQLWNWLGLS